MHSETLLSLFLSVLPTLLRWHVSVSPTVVLARSANDAGASTAVQSGRTKGTSQLPYGSGETIGELVLRTQAERKAATLRVI